MPDLGALGMDKFTQALGRLCLIERVTPAELSWIEIIEDEISVRIVGADGRSRVSTLSLIHI